MAPFGLIFSVILFGVLLLWAAVAFSRKVQEKPSERSSHYESGTGASGWHGHHDQ